MALAPGTRLGAYEVISALGSGGMGEVYRARDSRLGREVAIKVLAAAAGADPLRRARLVTEARAASALNHPHIVTVHAIESCQGFDYIVMELVRGETLAHRLRRGALAPAEALRLAIPLADALAKAHASGIVHRDVKPANVMLGADGVVKVLDFGVARLTEPEAGDAEVPTGSSDTLSTAGTVVGTVGYMSPEQARGERVDARSDVFSFGLVLYEMVTGQRAFGGGSTAEMLAALLKDEPAPPSARSPELPREMERLIHRCLRKNPDRRFQCMADVKVELQEIVEELGSEAVAAVAPQRRYRRRLAVALTAGASLLAIAAAALWRASRPTPPPPALAQVTWSRHAQTSCFSPDGSQVAFASTGDQGTSSDIWLTIVGEVEARRLTTDPRAEDHPAWSPDGKRIAFLRREREGELAASIHVISPLGGEERRLVDGFLAWDPLSWSPDGRWLAAAKAWWKASGTGIYLIPAGGGEPRQVTFPKPGAFDTEVAFSPDGRALAYACCVGATGAARGSPACEVCVQTLDREARPDGPVRRLTRQSFVSWGLDWTRDGRSIVYASAAGPNSRLWRVRADGSARPERVELAGAGAVSPVAARTRDRLLFTRMKGDIDIDRFEVRTGAAPLIASALVDRYPQYSPDGRRIAFQSDRADERSEIWLAEADGTKQTRLTSGPGLGQGSPRWSPDGRAIAFDSKATDGRFDIWTIAVDGSGLRRVTFDGADENMPSWSHDGRFVYYASNREGRSEIWRVPASGGSEEQITREGGFLAAESLDGRTLYYLRASGDAALLERPIAGGPERVVVPCVDGWAYAVDGRGVFHVDCPAAGAPPSAQRALRHRDARSGRERVVASIDVWTGAGMSATADGSSILFGRGFRASDLMIIDGFR